ncbi:MAG: DUF799 family lipoprotein [Elusimicrobia bacterium]|nr:DUF799 family lipoprotein [Elusimicrobiota bacterium]
MKSLLISAAFCLALGGCASSKGKAHFYKEGFQAPDIVAVLPPDNESNDLAAGDTYRRVMATALVALGYFPLASPAQEAALEKMGVSDGGQLAGFKPQDIAENLGTQGLLYGKVEEFNDLNTGIYRSRKAQFVSYLTDAKGEKLWQAWGMGVDRKISQNIAASLAEGLATKMVQKMLRTHLLAEASTAGREMMQKIPEWPEPSAAKIRAIKKDLK